MEEAAEELSFEGLPLAGPTPAGPLASAPARIAGQVQRAHASVLEAHRAIAVRLLSRAVPPEASAPPGRPVTPPDPRPLARTPVRHLTAADLDALARGDIAEVLGAAFDQSGLPDTVRPARWTARQLRDVTVVDPRGGRHAQGRLRAAARLERGPGALASAVREALRAYAFHQGLHLCVLGARLVPLPEGAEVVDGEAPSGTELLLDIEVRQVGMVPRPYMVADCRATSGGHPVARLSDVGIALHETPGTDLSVAGEGGRCRKAASGARTVGHELHMAHAAEGDSALLSPRVAAAGVTAPVRPRLPRGDLLMLARVVEMCDTWREYAPGSAATFEYDVPEDPWYVRENHGSMPQLAFMEAALQAGGAFGGMLGGLGEHPGQGFSCRNLEGSARLLRPLDPRGTTIEQHVSLRSHSPLPGGFLHRYGFELRCGGEPFYSGETVHGYLTAELLAQQKGLDGGRYVPPWLDRQPAAPAGLLRLDLRGDARLGSGRLALLEDTVVVPGGGTHRAGYVLTDKPVRPDDWFFDHHFFHDPVMPGSAGVQMLHQAVHAYALHTGLTRHLRRPVCRVAAGEELRWSYRGQILRHHRRVRGEVHIRAVRRDGDRLTLCADGSVWRDDLRIYRVDNIAVEISEAAGRKEPTS
ncbi:3-hydroxyacyl-ACP dehydratase [Streptomyces sp. NPDC002537]